MADYVLDVFRPVLEAVFWEMVLKEILQERRRERGVLWVWAGRAVDVLAWDLQQMMRCRRWSRYRRCDRYHRSLRCHEPADRVQDERSFLILNMDFMDFMETIGEKTAVKNLKR